jgi:Domain of unknown function (DUF4342)
MTADQVTKSLGNVATRAKDLFSAAKVRRIVVRSTNGSTVLEAPLTLAVVVSIVAPLITGVGAIAALVLRYTLAIEQRPTDKQNQSLERRRHKPAV